jgi:polysaccharide export outer membrane protein
LIRAILRDGAAFFLCALLGVSAALAQTPPVPVPPSADSQASRDYVIGPGDVLQVFVWRSPELSVTVPVRPDGRISSPLVENMVAVGKTPAQLAKDIEVMLAEYVRNPQVNIIVANPVGLLGQVKIIGQVKAPMSVPYRAGLKVLDVVLQAGGVTEFAAANRSKIVRNLDGKRSELKVRIGDLVEKGRMDQNLELRPGDVLVIPASLF